MSFSAKDRIIGELLVNAIYAIPRNQRKYVWSEENWRDLFSDLKYSMENKTKHFIGSVVLKVEDKEYGLSRYTIIDGQQRTMTITIMLLSVMYVLKKKGMKDNAIGIAKNLKAINSKADVMPIIESSDILALRRLTDKIYSITCDEAKIKSVNSICNKCIIDKTKDEGILGCFKYFVNILDVMDNAFILEYLEKSLEMIYVHIEAVGDEDSYTIFETLNARGEPLEDHELLKNFIMRYIQPRQNVDDAKAVWSSMELRLGDKLRGFIKHYIGHKFKTDDTTRKTPYKLIKKEVNIGKVTELLDDLELKSKYYEKIINPTNHNVRMNDEQYYFEFFKSKRQEQFRPLILSLMQQLENECISEEVYLKVLNYLYNFFICYVIVGREKSNKIHDLVYSFAYKISSADKDDTKQIIEDLLNDLNNKLPTKDVFLKSFSNLGYSKHMNFYKETSEKNKVKTVLQLIEQFHTGKVCFYDFTIEHMYPDNEGLENVKIGNLIPLELEINKNLGSLPLEDKISKYKESNFASARKVFINYEKYGVDINRRGDRLANLLYDNILNIGRIT